MPHTVRSALATLVSWLVAIALAGCSQSSEPDPVRQAVSIPDVGLAFELPEGWVELDPAEARAAVEDEDLMAELVDRHGPDSQRFGPVHIFNSLAAVPRPGPDPLFMASDKGVPDEELVSGIAGSLEPAS